MRLHELREIVYVLGKLGDITATMSGWHWEPPKEVESLGVARHESGVTFSIRPGDSGALNGYSYTADRRKAFEAGGPNLEINLRACIKKQAQKAAAALARVQRPNTAPEGETKEGGK